MKTALLTLLLLAPACSLFEQEASEPVGPQPIVPGEVAGYPQFTSVGDVLMGGQPTPLDLADVRDGGIGVVINLRTPQEMTFDEAAVVRGLGMRYVTLPVTPATLDDATVDAFIGEIEARQGPVLVHCASGNRVAALWAMYEIGSLGVEPAEAVDRARQLGLKSDELVAYIGDWSRRRGKL